MRGSPATSGRVELALPTRAVGALIFAGARGHDAVCAEMQLEIQQRMVITRTAFLATLQLNNGTDADYLEQVHVTLDIRDLENQPANNRVTYQTLELDGGRDAEGQAARPYVSNEQRPMTGVA